MAAAEAVPATQQPVTANVVGNAFVAQYYHILHHSPALAHRFYQDISKLGRPEEDGSMSITTTMQAINDKIVSLNYGELKAEIKSVDAQESFSGGVHVLVTGCLTGKDDKVSNFAQTFFLAPQDKGYFVLNDMFRFMINTSVSPPLVSDDVVPIAEEPGIHTDGLGTSRPPSLLQVGDRASDSTSSSSDVEFQDNVWLAGNPFRIDFKASEPSGSHHSTETGNLESELLKSLFNMPTPKSAEKEPSTMNWRNKVKKMTSLGQRFENSDNEQGKLIHDKGNEYQVLRGAAHQHLDSMKSYYQNAVTAFSNGEKEYASYLSGQGRLQSKMAREADEKASRDIFTVRNKSIENVITIDLHGQHIKQACAICEVVQGYHWTWEPWCWQVKAEKLGRQSSTA